MNSKFQDKAVKTRGRDVNTEFKEKSNSELKPNNGQSKTNKRQMSNKRMDEQPHKANMKRGVMSSEGNLPKSWRYSKHKLPSHSNRLRSVTWQLFIPRTIKQNVVKRCDNQVLPTRQFEMGTPRTTVVMRSEKLQRCNHH